MDSALLALLVTFLVLGLLSVYTAHRILTGNGLIPLTVRPELYGLPFEPVSCRTSDGLTLKGWFVPAKTPSARTILFCHGWSANKGEILRGTHALAAQGFNLLYFDFRCCGESEGELLSVGYLEARDFDAMVAFLRSFRPDDRYAVYGMSMGGMVVFSGAARHDCFDAAVIESTFRSHGEAVSRYLHFKSGVPYYPLIPMIQFCLRVRLGGDVQLDSPESHAPNFKIPVLGVCGAEDRVAAPELTEALLARVPSPHELWIVPGAGHAGCAQASGAVYTDRLARFYNAHFDVAD
jgi:pimeloyl-ACP methyl ester carboxylesterase